MYHRYFNSSLIGWTLLVGVVLAIKGFDITLGIRDHSGGSEKHFRTLQEDKKTFLLENGF